MIMVQLYNDAVVGKLRLKIEGGGGNAFFSALKIADFPGLCVASLKREQNLMKSLRY